MNDLQGHSRSLQLLLLDRSYTSSLPVSGLLLQHLYLAPLPRC